ncbi:protein COFACTOR ASSEMBLY OF COMPLEX C SUBUNIT B CCB2, chloroplastic [Andrographis paniculata]|uniref:protein COFACTOR ASSEMBLY OF COMPLEX C SUBUNIT B CCB2, chloroplastic n=1 Tax=Andrographis paniculata TaxID=175694 RepID=UPI0021E6FC98|nr:protein COFACTOR ASSEMBLY OF COMPLEX C SUBUNIT B CCB2, chloroplastic [Andrographis paniculata]
MAFNSLVFSTSRAKFDFPSIFGARKPLLIAKICCSKDNNPQQQVNLSVLRFTLGIPGLDESYLPRYIGYAFGALLVANHFLRSDSSSIAPAQLRTEALGLSLAAFSAFVPYVGKFLKGAKLTEPKTIPEGSEQIFVMSQEISDSLKQDLAWGTYALLRNTNSISVLISVGDALCVRGYWNIPKDLQKQDVSDWFREQIRRVGLSYLKDSMYFQQAAESELKEIFPRGTRSVLVQPILEASKPGSGETEKSNGFVLLASNIDYAYTDKDRSWIAAIANKFKG